ncbi:MAG: RnfABCDGE type electron transport complex subunit B [Lachnospiraceae bacterium]
MNISGVFMAAAIVGGTGILIGLFLGFAAEKFKVKVDGKEIEIRELLPGNNCGGCGYAGCDALAKGIACGEAGAGACPVGGAAVAEKIGRIIGAKVSLTRKVAFVKCHGTCGNTSRNYEYSGDLDCHQVMNAPGKGPKSCSYGCAGLGSCVKVCDFDAISIVDGIAVVDKEKCVACGKCVAACPKKMIEFVPYDALHMVACNSHDKGKDVRSACHAGCLGCMLCVKNCEAGAITVQDNIAHIDYDKCTGCGVCAEKCPAKIIV